MTNETGPDPLTPGERREILREHLEREKQRRHRAEAALNIATSALRRLADPTEIDGFGDADAPHNNTPEMRARLRHAARTLEQVTAIAAEGALWPTDLLMTAAKSSTSCRAPSTA